MVIYTGTTVTIVRNGSIQKNGDLNQTFENCFLGQKTTTTVNNNNNNNNLHQRKNQQVHQRHQEDTKNARILNQKLDIFLQKMIDDEEESRMKNDWRICALTLDRISLIMFLIIFLATIFGIFLKAPGYVS